jgi:hypothetical protein
MIKIEEVYTNVCDNRFNVLIKKCGKENVKYLSKNKEGMPGISMSRTWIYAKNKSGNCSAVFIEGPDCKDGCVNFSPSSMTPPDVITTNVRDSSCDDVTVIVPTIDEKKIREYDVMINKVAFSKLGKNSQNRNKLGMCQYDSNGNVSVIDVPKV